MGYPQYSKLKFAMQEEGKTVKKEKEKTFEKGVDKSGEVCYNSKAVWREGRREQARKNLERKRKNILTNAEMCDTICKLSSRGESKQDLEN